MFEVLKGQVISKIDGLCTGSDEVIFTLENGKRYRMYHSQCCCESVSIEDICGDESDIIGSEILLAEDVSNEHDQPKLDYDSYTWTFYKLATIKGYVDIRWLGSSNGYYSERVDFEEM